MNRGKALVKNTIIISIGTFLPKIASFITLPILTAALSKREYGTYDLINTLVSFFLPVVTLQIQSAAFRFLIDYREDEIQIKGVITNIIIFIIPVSIVSLFLLFFVLLFLPMAIRILICVYFFLDILVSTARQIVRGLANNMLYSVSAVAETLLSVILIIGAVKIAGKGLIGLLFTLVISVLAALIILITCGRILTKVDMHCVSIKMIKEMLSYSWPLIPSVMSNVVLMLSDRLVITAFLGLEANAVYAVANKIPNLLFLVQNTFTYAWQENASLAFNDDNVDAYYTAIFDIVIRILAGATAMLIAITPMIFTILIRGDYAQAYTQMPILFGAMMLSIITTFIGGIYIAFKQTKSIALTTTVAAVLNLIINILLIKFIGIYAASISTFLSYLFLCIYRMRDIRQSHSIQYNYKKMGCYALVLILICILYWQQRTYFDCLNAIIAIVFAVSINQKLIISMFQILKEKILK